MSVDVTVCQFQTQKSGKADGRLLLSQAGSGLLHLVGIQVAAKQVSAGYWQRV